MTVNLSALGGAGQQFLDDSGNVLTGGKLYSYAAGTTTPQTTYTSASGATAHSNPIILNAAGRVATGEIWLTAGLNYKFVLYTSTDVLIASWDNITGINGTGIATNAALVTYDPAGVGAVPTTVQAKLRETVSVEDFGAVGDGDVVTGTGTNNTPFFDAAIAYLVSVGGGTLNVPAGVFRLATFISMPVNVRIDVIGTGRDATTFLCNGDCFRWVNLTVTQFNTVGNTFKDFTVYGILDTEKYAFRVDQRVNLIYFRADNVRTYTYIAFLKVTNGSFLTGFYVENSNFSYPFTGANGFLVSIETNTQLNSLNFSNTWFSNGAAGAIKSLTSTGYCKFESCVFESNYGQYAVDLTNPQVHFDSCIFTNNSRTLGVAVDAGAHIRLGAGNQQFAMATNCNFTPPDPSATNFMAISKVSGFGLQTGVTVNNCFFTLAANYQKALVLDTEAQPDNSLLMNNRFLNTTGDVVTGRDVRRLNNFGDTTKASYPKNIVSSRTTTDTATYQLWGGTSFGPTFNYPANNSTALYEAKVTARNVDGTIYFSNIIRSLIDFKTGGTGFTATILGTMNETPIESSGWSVVSFAVTANNTVSAGVVLNVRCTTLATQIEWFSEVSISASTYG